MPAHPSSDEAGDEGEPGSSPRGVASGPATRLYRSGDIIVQKYRLVRLLGEGGMGAVWLAHNEKLDVDVAIKLIRYERATEETSERLLQEARAAARIGHRSIVRVFDFGETELDDPFIVMELLTGESLRGLLDRKGRLPATQAVRTLLPIASALVEAHANGIVHRDLKPENVMLVPDTSGGVVPKLLDFGIAQFRRGDDEGDDGRGPGLVAGTPEYMSPEQAGHDAVDDRADVWALAVMLYEAITGRVPFAGPSHAALIFAIMTEEPASITEQAAGDARLWGILKEALAKRASARPSMRAFGTSLAQWGADAGLDSDVAGGSLAAHWLNDSTHPFSAAPPPVAPHDGGMEDVVVPRAAPVPKGLSATTEAPPPSPAGKRRPLWIAAAGVAAAAALGVALRGSVSSGRASEPPPSSVPAPTSHAAAAATPSASEAASATPAATASTEPAAASASAAPATSAEPPSGVPGLHSGHVHRRPPRKSNLPIAKQPNF